MKFAILVAALLLPFNAHALEALKCNTMSGKTLWAGFGRIVRSGDPTPTYYPIEFTIFKSRTELQDRVYFARTKDALAIKISVTPVSLEFAFPAKNGEEIQSEEFSLRLYSPKDSKAYVGTWMVTKADGSRSGEHANCSVYQ